MGPTGPGASFQIIAAADALSALVSVTVTAQTLLTWQTTQFTAEEISTGKADAEYNFDGNRQSNLLEYAFGTDPRVPGSIGNLQVAVHTDSEAIERLALTFSRPVSLPDLTYQIEVSQDLQTWSALSSLKVISAGVTEVVTGRDPLPAPEARQRFIRLQVVRRVP